MKKKKGKGLNLKLGAILKNFVKNKNATYQDQLKQIDPMTKKQIDPSVLIDYNIYEAGPTMKNYIDNHMRIHQHWKHKFIYPILYFGRKILGKNIVKEVNKVPQYKNLWVFNRAFEEALKTWVGCICTYKVRGSEGTREDFEHHMTGGSVGILRTLKEFLLTIVKNDTAYLEFLNVLMYHIALEMNKNYPPDPAHIVYVSNKITDIAYFAAVFGKDGLSLSQIKDRRDIEPRKKTKVLEVVDGKFSVKTASTAILQQLEKNAITTVKAKN